MTAAAAAAAAAAGAAAVSAADADAGGADVADASGFRGCPLARVIRTYDARKEKESGYLAVAEGATIAFMSHSRTAPEPPNLFQCEYVYAGLGKEKGWIPVDILDKMD